MDKSPGRDTYDVAIIGGGMVGASLACALSHLPLRVIMIETAAPQLGRPPTYDDRARWLAMMKASVRSTREAFSVERMLGEYETKLYRTS